MLARMDVTDANPASPPPSGRVPVAVLMQFAWPGVAVDEGIWARLVAEAERRQRCPGTRFSAHGLRAWVARASGSASQAGSEAGMPGVEAARAAHDAEGTAGALRLLAGLAPLLAPSTIALEPGSGAVRATRDLLGARQLAWARVPGGLLVATGESLLLGHPAVDRGFDMEWLAAYAAGVSPAHEATVWRGIRLLAAGQTRTWTPAGDRATRDLLEPVDPWPRRSEAARAGLLRELIDAALARALAGAGRVGVSLSSGLDSTTLLARLVAGPQRREPRPLAVTYGFDRFPDIDERPRAASFAGALGCDFVGLAVDDACPLRPALARPVCPDTPLATPWREIKERSYGAFTAAGVDTVVSGNFSDHLWAHPKHWAAEALAHGRLGIVGEGLRARIRRGGWRSLVHEPGLRALLRPWRLRRPRPPARLGILAAPWRERLAERLRAELRELAHWPRPEQAHLALNAWASFDTCGEDWYAARHGLRVVQPWRDPALTAALLSLPAWDSQRGPRAKHLLRAAMRDRLPPFILEADKVGDLGPFAVHCDAAEADTLARLAASGEALLAPLLAADALRWTDPGEHQWMLASLGLWLERDAARDGPAAL